MTLGWGGGRLSLISIFKKHKRKNEVLDNLICCLRTSGKEGIVYSHASVGLSVPTRVVQSHRILYCFGSAGGIISGNRNKDWIDFLVFRVFNLTVKNLTQFFLTDTQLSSEYQWFCTRLIFSREFQSYL